MKHKHNYDEYGLCFECDKPSSKSAMMKRLRADRKRSGLVAVTVYVLPAYRGILKDYAARLRLDKALAAEESKL